MGLLSATRFLRYAKLANRDVQGPGRNIVLDALTKIANGYNSNYTRRLRDLYNLERHHMPEPFMVPVNVLDKRQAPPEVVMYLDHFPFHTRPNKTYMMVNRYPLVLQNFIASVRICKDGQ